MLPVFLGSSQEYQTQAHQYILFHKPELNACWIITGNYHFHLIQDTEILRYESYSDVQWQCRKIFLFPLCFSLVGRLSCCAVLRWLQYWPLILLLSLGFIYKSGGMDLGNWSEWETVCCTCLSSNCESFHFPLNYPLSMKLSKRLWGLHAVVFYQPSPSISIRPAQENLILT